MALGAWTRRWSGAALALGSAAEERAVSTPATSLLDHPALHLYSRPPSSDSIDSTSLPHSPPLFLLPLFFHYFYSYTWGADTDRGASSIQRWANFTVPPSQTSISYLRLDKTALWDGGSIKDQTAVPYWSIFSSTFRQTKNQQSGWLPILGSQRFLAKQDVTSAQILSLSLFLIDSIVDFLYHKFDHLFYSNNLRKLYYFVMSYFIA